MIREGNLSILQPINPRHTKTIDPQIAIIPPLYTGRQRKKKIKQLKAYNIHWQNRLATDRHMIYLIPRHVLGAFTTIILFPLALAREQHKKNGSETERLF
jgi:hypothetical protein